MHQSSGYQAENASVSCILESIVSLMPSCTQTAESGAQKAALYPLNGVQKRVYDGALNQSRCLVSMAGFWVAAGPPMSLSVFNLHATRTRRVDGPNVELLGFSSGFLMHFTAPFQSQYDTAVFIWKITSCFKMKGFVGVNLQQELKDYTDLDLVS